MAIFNTKPQSSDITLEEVETLVNFVNFVLKNGTFTLKGEEAVLFSKHILKIKDLKDKLELTIRN